MLKWPRFRLRSRAQRPSGTQNGRPAVSMLLVAVAASVSLVVAACSQTLPLARSDDQALIGSWLALPAYAPASDPSPVAEPTLSPTASPSAIPSASPSVAATVSPSPTATPAPKAAATLRKNSLVISALGINATIKNLSTCGGLISNYVYRWPCAGQNNLYLLGHAYGVFRPVHDGYHAGRLKAGMIALYVDARGSVHRYKLSWVEDLPIATWGKGATWAATSGPAITLQTCDGASDSYRIIVRFVPA
jgi:hypothetical protein